MVAAPWLHPCAGAFFKVRDNAVSHAGVNVLTAETAFGGFVFRGHWFSFSFGNGLQRAHATLPFGENGGSKCKGEAIREGYHPACTSPASKTSSSENSAGRGRLGKPGPSPCAREGRRP